MFNSNSLETGGKEAKRSQEAEEEENCLLSIVYNFFSENHQESAVHRVLLH